MLNKGETALLLGAHPIFASLSGDGISSLISDPRCKIIEAKSGSELALCDCGLGLILSGSLLVFRRGNGLPVLLQRLGKGKMFGAASLFASDNTQVTELRAESDVTVFFIPDFIIRELIEGYGAFALAYVTFLSGKIRFLNKRISELSAPSTTQKVAMFLLREDDNIAPTRVKLASALGIGRASLYRALDELSEKGLIAVDGKTVTVIDREGLMSLI